MHEITSLAEAHFLLHLIGATLNATLRIRTDAPLRKLFKQIRTSYYLKHFLFFLLASNGPDVLLPLAIGA
jgi:hypothetical protein